jgi:hypothetical protein
MAVHGHERLCGTDGNSLHVGTAGEDWAWIHLGGAAAQTADERDLAADANGVA